MILYLGSLGGGFYLIDWMTVHQLNQKVIYKEVAASQVRYFLALSRHSGVGISLKLPWVQI